MFTWLMGPDFLWKSEEAWLASEHFTDSTVADDVEAKREPQVFSTNAEAGARRINKLFKHFSQ